MARANLHVQREVLEAFVTAQENLTTRYLRVKIQGEELFLDSVGEKVQSTEEDFANLLPGLLPENEAAFLIFSTIGEDSLTNNQWLLITWVPEGCRVRDKMLFSSSKEDLKRQIGLAAFKAEYAASKHEDLVWQAYLDSQKTDFDINLLTEAERLQLEEKNAVAQESSGTTKSSALTVIPFDLSPEVTAKFQEYKVSDTNWVEMTINGEVIELIGSKRIEHFDSFIEQVTPDTASFIITKLPDKDGKLISFFIYSCPEETHVRKKMTMSSSKAAVLASATHQGLSFDKFAEIRSSQDIDEVILPELNPVLNDGSLNGSSAAAVSAHAKPQRPGRGKAKVTKFTAGDA